ncbi:MAG: DUF2442 domain-containing protein [Pseudomonadota bacterium]
MTIVEIDLDAMEPLAAQCDDAHLHVTLASGQIITTPLWWYPRLQSATPDQRSVIELMVYGIHWPEIDEDLSIEGMLKGWRAKTAVPPETMTAAG